ncbi:MAG TPA: hypothetical protein VMU64_03290 [Acidimicrobiales bacterium]|nr:hypothetical protein [Acidimicrobiales bacterium]
MSATNGKVTATFQLMEGSEGVQYRFFTIHGYRRAFLSAGQGPPLLLIHGIGDSSSIGSRWWSRLQPTTP